MIGIRPAPARAARPSLLPPILLALSVLAGCGRGAQDADAGSAQEGPKPVARVNGVDITEKMVENAIDLFLSQRPEGAAAPSPDQRATLHQEMIEALINQELMVQSARKEGIQAPADEVARRLQVLETRYGSREAMEKALREAGLDADGVKRLLERNLEIDALIDKRVRAGVQVDDAEVEAYYRSHPDEMRRPEGVRASHILVRAEEGKASEEERRAARGKAEGLLARVRRGEDFAALASQHSDDGSASRGGDLGYFPRGQMTPNFERSAFSLKVGQVSGVVETPYGYHIIKVTDRQPAKALQLADVRDALRRRLQSEGVEKRSQAFVEDLRREAKLERF